MKDDIEMTDESQEPTAEPVVENRTIESNIASPQPQKTNKNLWKIAGIVIGVLCLCSVLCLVLIGAGVGKVMVEQRPVEIVLDTFMQDMVAKDIESAYDLFSPRSQRQTPSADLEKMIQGNNYKIFEGYESLSLENFNLRAAANTNPDVPQGTIAEAVGSVSYTGGFTGKFNAVLEKVDGLWKFFYINIAIPPDKTQP
jgi:hypothetical protein